jgi:glycosyltransferase involved in cell wall biosynthesis
LALSRWLILSSITLSSGTGIRIKGIANGLVRNGIQVCLVGAGEHGDLATSVKYIQVRGRTTTLATALRLFLANLWAVVRTRPDFCLASKPLPHSVLPALVARWLGADTFLDFDDLESGYWQGRLWGPLLVLMEKLFPKLLHRTCVHTQELAEEVETRARLGRSRVVRLDQGVEIGLFTPRKSNHYTARPVALYAAHLGVAAEGLHFVLEGFHRLEKKNINVMLLVVGGGPLAHRFHQKVRHLRLEKMVLFFDQLPHRLMPEVMNLARVAVNYTSPDNPASRYRASVKVREYLAMGLPVATNFVGSDLTPFVPFLEVFKEGDVEAFALAVERVLDQGRSEEACRELREKWAWEVVVGRFLRELQLQMTQS